MHRLLSRSAALTLGLLLVSQAALEGQITPRRSGTLTRTTSETVEWSLAGGWRGPSGFAGTDRITFMGESDRALTSMNWRERRDDAVWFEFVGRTLCADMECGYSTDRYFNLESGNLVSQRSVVTGDEHYARALSVCTSGSGKIKGVQLWSVRIRANRTLQDGGTDEFSRTNCRNWHSPVQCPENAVIVGLRAHHTEDKGFVGLSIRCGRVS